MKKIMFNDKYGLTKAVLEGRKTQTRRIINLKEQLIRDYQLCYYNNTFDFLDGLDLIDCYYANNYEKLPFKIGEILAVAQSYKDCGYSIKQYETSKDSEFGYLTGCGVEEIPMKWPIEGYNNKMFVRADLMPHQIRITDVKIERIQDISDEDCLKEGVVKWDAGQKDIPFFSYPNSAKCDYDTPQEAFANLINKVSKKDVWSGNPYVFVYDFELVK